MAATRQPAPTDYTFERALLSKLGLPVTDWNVRGIALWAQSEGVNPAYNNPLAITNPHQQFGKDNGKIPGNSAGVAQFSTMSQAVNATAAFLQANNYKPIIEVLQTGKESPNVLQDLWRAINNSPWAGHAGTGTYPNALRAAAFGGTTAPDLSGPGNITQATGGDNRLTQKAGCDSTKTIIGGSGPLWSFNILNQCQAKAVVGGLFVGLGAVVFVGGLAMIGSYGLKGVAINEVAGKVLNGSQKAYKGANTAASKVGNLRNYVPGVGIVAPDQEEQEYRRRNRPSITNPFTRNA